MSNIHFNDPAHLERRRHLLKLIEAELNLNDPYIFKLHQKWDKSDCSESGLVKILLIQLLYEHILINKDYADVDQVNLLKKLENSQP